jgi:hypothetical protein
MISIVLFDVAVPDQAMFLGFVLIPFLPAREEVILKGATGEGTNVWLEIG